MIEHILTFNTEESKDFAENWIYDNFALEDAYTNWTDDDKVVYTFCTSTKLDKREVEFISRNVKPIKSKFNEV